MTPNRLTRNSLALGGRLQAASIQSRLPKGLETFWTTMIAAIVAICTDIGERVMAAGY
jgi:hypothetical protein